MSQCRRFEREGLLQLERGVPLDEHFLICPDCVREREAYERLKSELKHESEIATLKPGWEQAVLKAVATTSAAQPQPKRRWAALAAACTASAALLVAAANLWLLAPPPSVEFRAEVVQGATPVRAEHASVGDRLTLHLAPSSYPHVALRVYLADKRLVFECSRTDCAQTDGSLKAATTLRAPGSYQPLALLSDTPLPPPTGQLDQDLLRARDTGAVVEVVEPIDVY